LEIKNKNTFSEFLNKAIVILLVTQIITVNLSIAISSIAFGIWIGLWLIQLIMDKKLNYDIRLFREIKLINIFVILYIFFEIFSRFFAVYPDGAFLNLKRLLLFLIFYVSIIKILDLKTLYKILIINICALSLISVYELIRYSLKFGQLINQMPFSEIRIDYFNYPLTIGEIKMLSFFSVFPLLFIKEKIIFERKYLVLILLPVFISMILTQSRNVFLALFICFIIYGIIANRKFLITFIIIIILSAILLPSAMTSRISSIADINHSSNSARISMWKVGLQMFVDHPFTGIADSHIKEIYETYKTPETSAEGVHLHSNFIMILATTGIFGFISYIGMFLIIFLKQIKYYRNTGNPINKMLMLGSILVMISFHISGIFEWSFGDHEVMTVFFFLIAVPFVIFKYDKTLT